MTPNFDQLAMFFSSSHNEYDLHGDGSVTKYGAWVGAATANLKSAARIVVTQNPRNRAAKTGETGFGPKRRRAQMLFCSRRAMGIDVIDTYHAFVDEGRPLTDLAGDSVHPTGTGYTLWWEKIKSELVAATNKVSIY